MTTRKADIQLTTRPTAFVTREEGAAELRISPSTWDEMGACGLLPKPCMVGPNQDLPRWLWREVEDRIAGEHRDDGKEAEPFFRRLADGKTKDAKRETA
jgi:hypothetical protein